MNYSRTIDDITVVKIKEITEDGKLKSVVFLDKNNQQVGKYNYRPRKKKENG